MLFIFGLNPKLEAESAKEYFKKKGFENAVFEFEFTKKIIIREIIIMAGFLFLYFYFQGTLAQQLVLLLIPWLAGPILSGVSRIGLQIRMRKFRFYFASACVAIVSRGEDYFKNMPYLTSGLYKYNK